MGGKYLMGLDNGGMVIKAGLYDIEGRPAAFASVEAEAIIGRSGEAERNMDELWRLNARAVRECIDKAGAHPKDILGVAVCGHGNGLYLIDENGRPVRNGIYSSDTRAKETLKRFMSDGTYEKIQPRTMQILYAGQPTVLMAYMKDNELKSLEKARWALTCTDYIRFFLTGEVYGEITNMSVLSAMDQNTRACDKEVFEALGIREFMRLMPPIRQSCDVCGRITKEAAAETGLAVGTPVAGGLYDAAACAIATGITDGSRLCVVAGTWSINEFICEKPVISRELFLTSVYCIDGYYMITEGSMTSASNLEWFVRNLMNKEKLTITGRGGNVYDIANEMAASVRPGESSIVFLPFLYGTNLSPDAKACFMGISGWHEKKHLIRAVYEGIAFSHYSHIEKLLRYRDAPASVRMAGGFTKSDVWLQMFADTLQLPIEVSEAGELGTAGAAMCAGVSAGAFPSLSEAAKVFTRISRTFVPDPARKEIYEKKYNAYKKIAGCLEPVWSVFD